MGESIRGGIFHSRGKKKKKKKNPKHPLSKFLSPLKPLDVYNIVFSAWSSSSCNYFIAKNRPSAELPAQPLPPPQSGIPADFVWHKLFPVSPHASRKCCCSHRAASKAANSCKSSDPIMTTVHAGHMMPYIYSPGHWSEESLVGKCAAGFPQEREQKRAGWWVGGVGSERGAEGKARPWEAEGQSGKCRERQSWRRTEPGEGNMGDGEFPWGVMGRDEWEGASVG